MKTFTKLCLFALVIFFSSSLFAQQSFLNTTGTKAPDKQDWIQQMHGPTVKVPAAPEGSKATGDNCSDPEIITLNSTGDLPYLTSETTNGRGNDYTETCLNDFDGGEDMIFRLDLAFDVTLKFELNPNGTPYSGIAINESCFDTPTTTCLRVSTDTYGTGSAHGFSVALEAGTYYIMVDTWPGPPYINNFDLTISETTTVPNDDCDNAQVVGLLNQYFYSTLEATPSLWPGDGRTDVWFSYTANFTGTLVADVCDSDFDTFIEIYDGCSGTLITSNDDGCGFVGLQSSVSFAVVSGSTYLIRVSGSGISDFGTGFLNLYEDPGACALVCPVGGTLEGETCGDNDNGACADAIAVVTGDTICGNLWANGGIRDTDWFKLELTSVSTVKVEVIGEQAVQFGMVAQYELGYDDCNNLQGFFTEYKITPGCVVDSIKFLNLPVGAYYFVVAPAFYNGAPCPGFDYQAAFTVIPDATGTLAGNVVDENNNPVEGVIIQADVFTTVTDVNGNYSMDIPAGTYDVYAWGYTAGLSSDVKLAEVVTESNTTTVNFTLNSGAPVLTAAADPDFGKVNLTWTPIPVKGGLKGTEIVMGEVFSLNDYTPNTTMDLEFTLIVYAPEDIFGEQDWGTNFEITLPADFTINSASDFPLYDGTTLAFSQSGQTVYWDAQDILSNFWRNGIEEHIIDFTINVDVALGASGPLVADYYFEGDGWTGNPWNFDGMVTIYQDGGPYVPTYNVYRKLDNGVPGNYFIPLLKGLPYEELNDVIVPGDKWCYYVTQVMANGLESAPSNEVCVVVKDACDDAIDYGVPGDAAQTFTMVYADQVVWFQVTLPTDMDIFVSTCNSDFDTQFAIYEDCANIPFSSQDLPAGSISHVTDGCDVLNRASEGYCGLKAGTYFIAVYGENGEFGAIDLEITQVQCLTIYNGWSGVSIYMNPSPSNLIQNVLFDMTSDMVITIRQTPYGIWWPIANINTIGAISPEIGYKVKMNATVSTVVTGTEVVSKSVTLPQGASYLPVKVPYEVDATDLVNELGSDMLLIYNMYNPSEIIWPGGNLSTLNSLIPGFAYLINMTTASSFTYPPFAKSANAGQKSAPAAFKGENIAWNTVVNTGNPHMNAIDSKAMGEVMVGDLIGVFNAEGRCVGVTEITTREENQILVAFGNDEYSTQKDGLEENELMRFKLYRPATETEYFIDVTFSKEMPNSNGLYATNGLSMITEMKLTPTSIGENVLAAINIYPNPSNGLLNISGLETDAQITVINAQGQVIYAGVVSNNASIDLSSHAKGVYMIKLVSENATRMTKVILK